MTPSTASGKDTSHTGSGFGSDISRAHWGLRLGAFGAASEGCGWELDDEHYHAGKYDEDGDGNDDAPWGDPGAGAPDAGGAGGVGKGTGLGSDDLHVRSARARADGEPARGADDDDRV